LKAKHEIRQHDHDAKKNATHPMVFAPLRAGVEEAFDLERDLGANATHGDLIIAMGRRGGNEAITKGLPKNKLVNFRRL
jgi:hypothetical protein